MTETVARYTIRALLVVAAIPVILAFTVIYVCAGFAAGLVDIHALQDPADTWLWDRIVKRRKS
jgi:hypothetical protein